MNGLSTTSHSAGARAALSYCVQQVRSHDYHHYLCLLHLPPLVRRAAFAFHAFNIETAKAMDAASNPKVALMRLLWWQQALDDIFSGKSVNHPVATALSSVTHSRPITCKHWLKRSLEARITDAQREPDELPGSINDIDKYAEDTQSSILYSVLQAGGIQSTSADHAASHVGKASGLVLLLKAFPYHLSKYGRISYLPSDIAEKHRVQEVFIQGSGGHSSEEFSEAVFEVASAANAHLLRARELHGSVPTEALPMLLPAVPAQVFLDSLRRAQFDVFDPRLARGVMGISPFWFQLKLAWHAWRRSY